MNPDVKVTYTGGTIASFFLLTDAAKNWVEENVDVPDYMGSENVFHVEHRYWENIVEGMLNDGLKVTVNDSEVTIN